MIGLGHIYINYFLFKDKNYDEAIKKMIDKLGGEYEDMEM
jgi:hypothetical protein